MAAAMCCSLPTRVSLSEGASPSFSGRTSTTSQQALAVRNRIAAPLQSRVGCGLSLSLMSGDRHGRRIARCAASGGGVEGQSSCCGGSGGGEGGKSGGKCSSHDLSKDDSTADLSGVGKEFEALVAQKTMQEFESHYSTGQLQGTISRDVISDVVNIYPEAVNNKDSGEKFLDVDELLAEARSLSSKGGDLIFDADFEDMLV